MSTPEQAVVDLKEYLSKFGLSVSLNAEAIFQSAEDIAFQYNVHISYSCFLYSAIRLISSFSSLINEAGGNSVAAIHFLEEEISKENPRGFNPYDSAALYSSTTSREGSDRPQIIDLSISATRRNHRKKITEYDLLEALLQIHDHVIPAFENKTWTDKKLQTPFNTLSHITGRFNSSLWVKFDEIRKHFGFADPTSLQRMPVESAPARIRSAILSLLHDYPDYQKNAFLIMPFGSTPAHNTIYQTLKNHLATYGYNLLRADEKSYSDDLLTNIEAYIYGTHFSIAIYERLTSDMHNPNVAFEVGYCQGLKKPVCILKEKTVKILHSDLSGRIYIEFDAQDIIGSIKQGIDKWLQDKSLI